jgi:hypothetical protein
LIKRLENQINGKISLSPTQVTSIKLLLDRVLPTLSAQEVTGGVTQFVARLPEVAENSQKWLESVRPERQLLEASTVH